ncbi:MAG: carbon monoxide dehydrogenase subunit G [Thaumarchaeota archaeon]|nr:carbon monoxide dehydrogenase subunit G [Nitrososphaerota archaeon]
MHFDGSYSIKAPKNKVFDLLTDPRQISKCMPDLQKLDVKSDDEFTVVVRAGVAFIKGDFTLNFKVVERNPPTHAKLVARGSGMGSAVDLQTIMDLTDEGEKGTLLKWEANATVGGRIASVGQRLLNSQAEKIVKQLFDCLESRFK